MERVSLRKMKATMLTTSVRSGVVAVLMLVACPPLFAAETVTARDLGIPGTSATRRWDTAGPTQSLTASTRLEFTSPAQGLLLRRLVHVPTGTEFLPHAGPGRSVWEVVLLNGERKLCSVKARPGASFATGRDESGATVYRLSWPKLDLPDAPGTLDVSVKIAVPRGSGLSYWQIEVANRSKAWGVWEVRFPRLEHLGPVGAPEEEGRSVARSDDPGSVDAEPLPSSAES